jgi:hypothetical protein
MVAIGLDTGQTWWVFAAGVTFFLFLGAIMGTLLYTPRDKL